MSSSIDVERLSMQCKVIELAKEAGIANPTWLISRDFGRLFFSSLQDKFASLPIGSTIYLNFENIDLLEWSFADESIVSMCLKLVSGEFCNRYLILEALSNTSIENLAVALRTRPERESKSLRNLVVLVIKDDGEITPVGKLEDHLVPVWNCLKNKHELTARDLATALDIEINIASTKLKTLYDLHILKRQETRIDSGKQYVYSKI